MFRNLRKTRREKNVKVKEIISQIGLKTEAAYYKKENQDVPFTLEESMIISKILDEPIEKLFT